VPDRPTFSPFLNLLSSQVNNTGQANDEFMVRNFLHSPVTSILLGPNVILSTLFLLLIHLNDFHTVTLRYKPEGRGFDSRWCLWKFSLTYNSERPMAPGSSQPPTERSTRNI
jgi:hypothetical protein